MRRKYLTFKNFEVTHNLGTEWLEIKKQVATVVFRSSNATNHVRVMFLEVKLHKVRSG